MLTISLILSTRKLEHGCADRESSKNLSTELQDFDSIVQLTALQLKFVVQFRI